MVDRLQYLFFSSPVGELLVLGDSGAVRRICFQEEPRPRQTHMTRAPAGSVLARARQELEQYFTGARTRFTVAVAPAGTDFQLLAWRALRDIPYGETRSYSDQARSLGRPKAVRAVGAANGRNPIPIIIPCHRVVGANGTLTGYAGGLAIKRFLLDLESRHAAGP